MVVSLSLHLDDPVGYNDAPTAKNAKEGRLRGLSAGMWLTRTSFWNPLRAGTSIDVWTEFQANACLDRLRIAI